MPNTAGTNSAALPAGFGAGLTGAWPGVEATVPMAGYDGETFTGTADASDEELVAALAAGDHSAMTSLFHRYHRLVYSVALGIVGDSHEAEDVVQIVFFDMFRAAAHYDIVRGRAKTWLLQYAYHRALHRRRHLASRHFYLWEDAQTPGVANKMPARSLCHPALILAARQAISRLTSRQRTAIELAYYEGLTAAEISRRTKQTAHVVRHDLRRAITAMRSELCDADGKEA
jgi:RNA polymerase sigma-70 factor (ECF subfamily)